jgi:hypothetical protein
MPTYFVPGSGGRWSPCDEYPAYLVHPQHFSPVARPGMIEQLERLGKEISPGFWGGVQFVGGALMMAYSVATLNPYTATLAANALVGGWDTMTSDTYRPSPLVQMGTPLMPGSDLMQRQTNAESLLFAFELGAPSLMRPRQVPQPHRFFSEPQYPAYFSFDVTARPGGASVRVAANNELSALYTAWSHNTINNTTSVLSQNFQNAVTQGWLTESQYAATLARPYLYPANFGNAVHNGYERALAQSPWSSYATWMHRPGVNTVDIMGAGGTPLTGLTWDITTVPGIPGHLRSYPGVVPLTYDRPTWLRTVGPEDVPMLTPPDM